MKTPLKFFAFVALVANAFGYTYHGTIWQTVTETNNSPHYYVGQTFAAHYSYESSTVDGTFYSDSWPEGLPPGANSSLDGNVYLTNAVTDLPLFHVPPGHFDFFSSGAHGFATLTVSGGVVTDFNWIWEAANNVATFTENSFWTNLTGVWDPKTEEYLPDLYTKGTVTFGAPAVPDTSWTAGLLGLSLAGLLALRRKLGAV